MFLLCEHVSDDVDGCVGEDYSCSRGGDPLEAVMNAAVSDGCGESACIMEVV